MICTDFGKYEKMTVAESLRRYDWGYELDVDEPVMRWESDEYAVMVGFSSVDGTGYWCEIEQPFEFGWEMTGQGWGETAEDALMHAACDIVGINEVKHEACCEDAVNVLAHGAYGLAYGYTPLSEIERDKMDSLLGAARRYVKDNIRFFGFDWEEF